MTVYSRHVKTTPEFSEFGHALDTDMCLSIDIPFGKFSLKISSAEGKIYTRELQNDGPELLTITIDFEKYKDFQSPFFVREI